MVNLAPYQTPIKDQGSRITWHHLCSDRWVEAASQTRRVRRSRPERTNFWNATGKNVLAAPQTGPYTILRKGEDGSESQWASLAVAAARAMSGFSRTAGKCREQIAIMGYHPDEYTAADHPHLQRLQPDDPVLVVSASHERRQSGLSISLPAEALMLLAGESTHRPII